MVQKKATVPGTYYNPDLTDESIEITQEDIDSPAGGFITEGWSTTAPIATPDPIVDGTDDLQEEEDETAIDANALLEDIGITEEETQEATQGALDTEPYIESTEGAQAMTDLTDMLGNLGVLTQDELDEINQAGASAGAEYDPLIEIAKRQKKSGQAKALVGAGKRGGLMNTQFAGIAALMQTEGGTWEGAGGKLEEIKSVYDLNIQNLESKKLNAINNAKSATKRAIRTGKKEDLQLAQGQFQLAKDAHEAANNLAMQKVDLIVGLQQVAQQQAQFELTVAGQKITNAQNQLNFVMENFGIEYLEANPEQVKELFADIGLDDADISTAIARIKEKSEQGTVTLQNVNGELYAVTITPDGKSTTELLVEKDLEGENVTELMLNYPDAGIKTTDTFDAASAKVKTSAKWRKETYIAPPAARTPEGEKLDKEFATGIESGLDELEQGRSWGTVFNNLFNQYKDKVEDQDELRKDLDRLLDKEFWSKPGAFREFKKSGIVPEDGEEDVKQFLNEDYVKNSLNLSGSKFKKAMTKINTMRNAGFNDKEIVTELYNI